MTEEQVVEVMKEKYGKVSAKFIAEECGVTLGRIYDLAKKYNIRTSKKRNKTVGELSELQKQILLSGIFGDGSYRKNGKIGFQYREQHASAEKEYCKWKFDNLGKLTEGYNFYCRDTVNSRIEPVYGFETMTTVDLKLYAELHKDKMTAIELLDEIGLSLLILDDGWKTTNTSYPYNITFTLTTHQYTQELRDKIIKQYEIYFGDGCCNEVGVKRIDLRFSKDASFKISEIVLNLLGKDMDIIQKKLFKGEDRIVNNRNSIICNETGEIFESATDLIRLKGKEYRINSTSIIDHLKRNYQFKICPYTFSYNPTFSTQKDLSNSIK